MYHRIFVDQLGFLVTIILNDDSSNQIFFFSKNKMSDIYFFFLCNFKGLRNVECNTSYHYFLFFYLMLNYILRLIIRQSKLHCVS
jgi:hypothetical protein